MAWNLVSHTVAVGSGATYTTTSAINTLSGGADLIIVSAPCTQAGLAALSLGDSAGNTWTVIDTIAPASGCQTRWWYCHNPTTATSHTFTVSNSASTVIYASVAVQAWSGSVAAGTSPLDQHTASAAITSGTTLPCVSLTPLQDGSLIVAGYTLNMSASQSGSMTIGSGLTISDSQGFVGGASYGTGLAYYVQPSAQAIAPIWTIPGGGTATGGGAVLASFIPAAGLPTITGTLGTTETTDTANFAGAVAFPAITGTLGTTETTDTASFAGAVAFPAITGTLGTTETTDLAAFAGAGAFATITATLAATETADTAAFAGALGALPTITGTLGAVEAADRAAFAGGAPPPPITTRTWFPPQSAAPLPIELITTGADPGIDGYWPPTRANPLPIQVVSGAVPAVGTWYPPSWTRPLPVHQVSGAADRGGDATYFPPTAQNPLPCVLVTTGSDPRVNTRYPWSRAHPLPVVMV